MKSRFCRFVNGWAVFCISDQLVNLEDPTDPLRMSMSAFLYMENYGATIIYSIHKIITDSTPLEETTSGWVYDVHVGE
jgi:hypothetical protein